MDERREENRRRLKELAETERRRRATAEPEIARKEAALARAKADLARVEADVDRMQAELDVLKAEPANDDAAGETGDGQP